MPPAENNTPTPPAPPTPPPAPEPPVTPPAAPSSDDTEDKEWDQAKTDLLENSGKEPEKKPKGEEVKDGDKDKPTGGEPEGAAKPGEEKPTPGDGNKPADKTEKPGEGKEAPAPPADTTVRDQRTLQREIAEDEKAMKSDIKEKLFSDVQAELTDSDGDPIRTIQDVQKLLNPNTGKPFTDEEAASYLLQAQRYLENQLKETDVKIQEIADVNLSIKDQADSVRDKYGQLLKALPNLQKQVWAAYEETLIKDEKTGIILKAPVNMQRFYDTALAGYMKLVERLEAEAKTKDEAEAKAKKEAADKKKEAEKTNKRGDREDIISTGKSDTTDPEEKEWEDAAKRHYEG